MVVEENENLGKMSISKAMDLAEELNLDLVKVSSNPLVCRIMDYNKEQYNKKQQEKLQKKNNRPIKTKEIRIKSSIDTNDLQTKVRSVINALKKGNNVQLRLFFKGRANAHKDIGIEIIEDVIKQVAEYGTLVETPQLSGNNISCLLKSVL